MAVKHSTRKIHSSSGFHLGDNLSGRISIVHHFHSVVFSEQVCNALEYIQLLKGQYTENKNHSFFQNSLSLFSVRVQQFREVWNATLSISCCSGDRFIYNFNLCNFSFGPPMIQFLENATIRFFHFFLTEFEA